MASGPEHYREAHRLLAHANELREKATPKTISADMEQSSWMQQRAQVHATLALAAAQIDAIPTAQFHQLAHCDAWIEATK